MKYPPFFRIFTAFTVITISLFSLVSPVAAKGFATVGTTMTIDPPVEVSVGNPTYVVIHLISTKGEPVVNQRVELFIDGVRERSARTDRTGTASIRVRRAEAGTYALSATFKGSKLPSLGSSKATGEMIIAPEIIEVHVTPPLPGIKLSLSGRIFSSDDYGVARIKVEKAGKYKLDRPLLVVHQTQQPLPIRQQKCPSLVTRHTARKTDRQGRRIEQRWIDSIVGEQLLAARIPEAQVDRSTLALT